MVVGDLVTSQHPIYNNSTSNQVAESITITSGENGMIGNNIPITSISNVNKTYGLNPS